MRWQPSGLILLLIGIAIGAAGVGALRFSSPDVTIQPKKTYLLRDDILIHGNKELKEIALTIDDGPKPEVMRELLNTLGRYKVKATFFVVGKQVELHPGLVRRMLNEGHEVGNHTYSHPRLTGLDSQQIKQEIADCSKSIYEATGAHSNLFRPPGMRYDDVVIRTAQDLGYVTVHWNVAARDFEARDPKEIATNVLDHVQPGSVILLHGHPDTLRALPEILETLTAEGYRFVRVSQMLGRLPRPVFVRTNAYGVKDKMVASIKKAATDGPRAASRAKVSSPKTEHTGPSSVETPPPLQGVDVPVGG